MLPEDELPGWSDIVRQQLDAGVDLAIVVHEHVEPDDMQLLRMDRFVITDKAGVRGALFYRTHLEGHTFTNDEAQIRETERILENFHAYEKTPESLYPDLSSR